MVTQVTGYAGYNKKSFLELTTTPNKASEQSSSSAGEEPVKIVIKEDIRKRPAASKNSPYKNSPSKKSSSKKSSSKKSPSKKSSSKKSSHQNN